MLSGAVVAAVLLLGEGGQVLGARLPVQEGVVPGLETGMLTIKGQLKTIVFVAGMVTIKFQSESPTFKEK